MQKREVKAFDIKDFNTKEEVIAEIQRLEALDKKAYKKTIAANKGLGYVILTAAVTGVISACIAIGSLFSMANLNTHLNDIAKTITFLDGYEEIYNKESSTLANKHVSGEISKEQFDKELKRLESREYIRSVAPEFCPNNVIYAYDETENQLNTKKTMASAFGATAAIGILSFLGAGFASEHISNKYNENYYKTHENLSDLYYKKEELEA